MTDLEILKAARAKIAQGWCRLAYSRRADGSVCLSRDSDASTWCAEGAIYAAFWSADADPSRLLDVPDAAKWNDAPGRTQPEVLALFDARIAKLEA